MTSTDSSIDARIWAYVRGEGGQVDRKKLESEVSSDPVAARRYASIKLTHQRELARLDAQDDETPTPHEGAAPKASSGRQGGMSAATTSKYAAKLDAVIFGLALLLTIASFWFYLAGTNWPPLTLLAIRDGLHIGAAILAIVLALRRRHSRAWILGMAVACIAATCAMAAMLVR